ncbi:hypothetical protein F4778DRAFT_773285 [Xylariomycetidae sp. FL2044]|nr:hypothetical protein F4778DRAFT_773285 [Xylariomycetidae sp. FL2044]
MVIDPRRQTLTPEIKLEILSHLWGQPPAHVSDAEAYIEYYRQQCELIGLHANGRYSSLSSQEDILSVAALVLLKDPPLTRDEILVRAQQMLRPATPEQHGHAVDLVARLLVMMRVGEVGHEFAGGGPASEWPGGECLSGFVRGCFCERPVLRGESVKLEKSFIAHSLGLIAGVDIHWTNNLADHLRLMNDDTVVCVFHHSTFLRSARDSPVFPPGLIEETLQTLALLFPKYDRSTRQWYRDMAWKRGLDASLVENGGPHLHGHGRQIESFRYWHDRLIVLKQVYDESRPKTLSQFWRDRRNGVQWYTFWVAVVVLALTVFFGLVQSIEGALQVYKAFHPPGG